MRRTSGIGQGHDKDLLVLTLKWMTSWQSFSSLSCGSPVSLISRSRSCLSCSGGCHSHTWRLSDSSWLTKFPGEPRMGVLDEPELWPQVAPKEQKTWGFQHAEAAGHHKRSCENSMEPAGTREVHSDLLGELTSDW